MQGQHATSSRAFQTARFDKYDKLCRTEGLKFLADLGFRGEDVPENYQYDLIGHGANGYQRIEVCHNKLLPGDLERGTYWLFDRKVKDYDRLIVFSLLEGTPTAAMWKMDDLKTHLTKHPLTGRYPNWRIETRNGEKQLTVGIPTSKARIFERIQGRWVETTASRSLSKWN